MLLAHLSDLHVTHPDSAIAAFADGASTLASAVEHLNGLDRTLDAVIITGDLVNDGTVEEYERLRGLLEPLDAPCYLMIGNHDDPDLLARVFAEHVYFAPARPCHWVIDDHPLRLIAIDTTIEGRHDGEVSAAELDWLAARLAEDPHRPTIVTMHHPPFVTGMWWMDYNGTANAGALEAVVRAHPNVVAVIAGHVHRAFQSVWGAALVGTAPSLTYQSSLGLSPDSAALVTNTVASIPLLWWRDDHLVHTTTEHRLDHQRLDLSTVIPRWDEYAARCRAGGPLDKAEHG